MVRPFHGARVIEVGGTLPVAAATKLFSDYGADVIKVEPPGGAEMRRLPPFPDDTPNLELGAYHVALDGGKRSLVLDPGTPSGREVLGRLGATAGLVVMHLPVASVEAAREAIERAASPSPGPSTVTLAAHGLEGPFAGRVENDASLFAWTTRMRQHAIAGHEPLRYAPNLALMQWGATAAAAGAAALWGREQGETARHVEVAGVEALLGNVDNWFYNWQFVGVEMAREPGRSPRYPTGCYRCADGYVLFSTTADIFFQRTCAGIGHPELADDPRFATPAARQEHEAEFMAYFQPWLERRSRDEIFTTLQHHGVMVAPVLDMPEVLSDRQAVARGSFVEVPLADGGKTMIAGPPFRMPEAWEARVAPRVGEHTVEIMDALGYSRAEQIALFRAGVTG